MSIDGFDADNQRHGVGDELERVRKGAEMYKIKAIIKRPDEEYGHVTNISPSLANLQKTVGGHIETISNESFVIICNEEGKIHNLEPNMRYCGELLVGTIIVCGIDGDEFGDIQISFSTWKKIVDMNKDFIV